MLRPMDTTPRERGAPAQAIVHPALAELRARRDALRVDLAAILERVDRCVLVDIPYARALYDEKLGTLELELLQLRASNASLRRRIELVVARRNRGEPVTPNVLAVITAQVDQELEAWWQELRQKERELRAGRTWLTQGSPADPQVVREVRKLYRELCRQLHPDATGGETEAFARHWPTVQTAYRELEVEVLRTVHSLVVSGKSVGAPDAIEELRDQCPRLEERIRAQLEKLEGLQKSPPLSHRAFLNDATQVAEKQAAVRGAIAAERTRASELELTMAAVGGTPWALA